MTTQQKYEEVRLAIIEAVPEIMKLEEGCRIEGGGLVVSNGWVYWDTPSGNTCIDNFDFDEEILGRPILIGDVLRALSYNSRVNHHNKNDFNKLEYGVGTDSFWIGNSITHSSMDWNLAETLEWHLENDPETIEWLWEILLNNK